MYLLLLSGNSIQNKEWIVDVEHTLSDLFDFRRIQYYKHWETGEPIIDLDHEVEQLVDYISYVDDYVIFAKSAGTLVTLKAINDNSIKPKKCVFVGMPIKWAHENSFNFEEWTKAFSIPTLIIQHENDPACSSSELLETIKNLNITNWEVKVIPGDSHHYPDLAEIHTLVKEYISR